MWRCIFCLILSYLISPQAYRHQAEIILSAFKTKVPHSSCECTSMSAALHVFKPYSVYHGLETYLSIAALWVLPENH